MQRQIPAGPVVEPFCPFNLTIAVAVAKLKLDCEKFSISGGEGIRFKYEKKFSNGASSISMGVGLGFDVGIGTSVKAGVSGEVSEGVFIAFDKDNNIVDGGFEVTARLSEEVIAASGIIKATGRTDWKGTFRIGVESGLSFKGDAFDALK